MCYHPLVTTNTIVCIYPSQLQICFEVVPNFGFNRYRDIVVESNKMEDYIGVYSPSHSKMPWLVEHTKYLYPSNYFIIFCKDLITQIHSAANYENDCFIVSPLEAASELSLVNV